MMNPDINEPAADDQEPLLELLDGIGDLAVPDVYDDAEAALSAMTSADVQEAFEQLLVRAGLATASLTTSLTTSERQEQRGFPAAGPAPDPSPADPDRESAALPVLAAADDHPTDPPQTCAGLDKATVMGRALKSEAPFTDVHDARSTDVRTRIAAPRERTTAHDELTQLRAEARRLEADLIHARNKSQASLEKALLAEIQAEQITDVAKASAAQYLDEAVEVAQTRIERANAHATRIEEQADARFQRIVGAAVSETCALVQDEMSRLLQEATAQARRIVAEAENFAGVIASPAARAARPRIRVQMTPREWHPTELHAGGVHHQMIHQEGQVWADPATGGRLRSPTSDVLLFRPEPAFRKASGSRRPGGTRWLAPRIPSLGLSAYLPSSAYDVGQQVRWLVTFPALVMALAVAGPALWATMR